MKSSFKFIVIILALLSLSNCSYENTTNVDTQSKSTREFKTGSMENFPKLKTTIRKIEKHGLRNKSGKAKNNYVIDKSTIIEIKDKDNYYYTAKIKNDTECDGCFKNIVINNPNTERANAFIYTYYPDEDYFDRQNSSHSTYITGKVNIEEIPIDDVDLFKDNSRLNKKNGDCITLYITMCSYEYDHVAQNTCFDGTHLYTVWITDCSGGGPHQGELPPPDSNNDGVSPGNDSPGGGGTYPLSTPNPFGLTTKLGLNSIQANWLNSNQLMASEINNFLNKNGESLQNKTVAKEIISILSTPKLVSNNQLDYKGAILKMTNHLKQWGNPEDEHFAAYIESVVPEFNSMTMGDVQDIYNLMREQVYLLSLKYLAAIVVPFAEAALPFIQYAIVEASLGAALPLLSKIPLIMVSRGSRLNKMLTNLSKIGSPISSNQFFRKITGSSVKKAEQLFKTMTKDAISVSQPNAQGTIVANMGNNTYITFRTVSDTPGVIATIDINAPSLFSQIVKLKFYP